MAAKFVTRCSFVKPTKTCKKQGRQFLLKYSFLNLFKVVNIVENCGKQKWFVAGSHNNPARF